MFSFILRSLLLVMFTDWIPVNGIWMEYARQAYRCRARGRDVLGLATWQRVLFVLLHLVAIEKASECILEQLRTAVTAYACFFARQILNPEILLETFEWQISIDIHQVPLACVTVVQQQSDQLFTRTEFPFVFRTVYSSELLVTTKRAQTTTYLQGVQAPAWMKENIERLEKEKQVYKFLNLHPHPHLLQSILCTPEGIFMPRLETTLAARLSSETPSLELQERWIRQLVSAAAWLEKLGYAHGDLRPHNILLDRWSNIVVADFDGTVPIGEELKLATLPFCKVDEEFETLPAGPETEQFSLGSCIYNIRFGFEPFSDLKLESPVWRLKLVRKEFPPTSNDCSRDRDSQDIGAEIESGASIDINKNDDPLPTIVVSACSMSRVSCATTSSLDR
ncbi:hypothetical protein KCU81_g103, partial [Aureobasidium melanogenum]